MKNKRGLVTKELFVAFALILASVLTIGIMVLVYSTMATYLNQDVVVTTDGRTLTDLNSVTFNVFSTGLANNADYIALGLIFGMVLFLFTSAYLFRGKYPVLFILVDIIIIIGVYIFATYLAYSYELLINSSPYLDVFINDLPKSSTFVLYLNYFVGIIGVLMMIVTYSMFPSDEDNPRIRSRDYENAY